MDGIMNIVYAILVLGIMGAVFGGLLAFAAKIFHVEQDPRIEEVRAALAGANCGGCGFAGCDAYAAAVVAGEAPPNKCSPGGAATAEKVAAMRFGNKGPKQCQFSCIGLGSCVKACQFGAMSIGPNGSAVVDPDKCTDCMACAAACPRHLIVEVPASKKVHVACANQDKGKAAMSVCANSCIGCGLCQKECKFDAIHVVNGVAVIDYDKCKGCKLCTKVCPRDAILPIATAEEKEKYKAIKKAQAEKAKAAAEAKAAEPKA